MDGLETAPNFGIENTIDTGGVGSQQLLDSLFEAETVTTSTDKITVIDKEPTVKTDDEGKGPDGKADPTKLSAAEDTETKGSDTLEDFLYGGDEEEEEEEEEEIITKEKVVIKPELKETKEEEPGENKDGIIAFDTLANELADLGVFSKMEGEEDGIKGVVTPEDFLERFNLEKQQAANQLVTDFIGQFGKEHQDAFNAIYVNGANPRDYFSQVAKVEDFSSLDLTKESNQERVVRQVLIDQGFETEDVDKEIDKLKSYGDLEDVSKRHHKVLIKKETASLAEKAEQAKIQHKYKQEAKQSYINNVRSILEEKIIAKEFDGIPVNTQTANELQDFLLVDKWKTESGETLTDFDKAILDLKNPENHQQKVKVALLLKLLEKDPTLSTIQKRGVSKKSSQLFKDVARQKTTTSRVVDESKKPTSWFQQ